MANLTIDRLKAQLLTSGLSQKDQPLFQVINQLIDYLRNTQAEINAVTGGGGGGGGGSLITMPFLTYDDVQATLPNSRQLTRQTGISFNQTPQRLVISTELLDWNTPSEPEPGPMGPPGIQGLPGSTGMMGPPGMDSCCDGVGDVITPLGSMFFPPFGVWSDIPFNASNFTGSGTMTWTVASGDQETLSYMRINSTYFVLFAINTSSIGGGASASLRIQMPFTARVTSQNIGRCVQPTGNTPILISMVAGSSLLQCLQLNFANWDNPTTDATYVFGLLVVSG